MANQNKDFARRLRLAMDSASMNQKELAEKSGCSKAAISQYCAGIYSPDGARLSAIAEALGVSPAFLSGELPLPQKRGRSSHSGSVRITFVSACRCLGKSEDSVRRLLVEGCEFGKAVQGSGSRLNYIFFPGKFREYVGAERFDKFFGLTG